MLTITMCDEMKAANMTVTMINDIQTNHNYEFGATDFYFMKRLKKAVELGDYFDIIIEINIKEDSLKIGVPERHKISLHAKTLIHSDQGSHYTSCSFINLIKNNELRQSMSRWANCWDNAPQESLFGHMKDEIDMSRCTNHQQIVAVIDDWIDYYNNERGQWDLARLSPNEYYDYLLSSVYPLPATPPKGAELTSHTDPT